MPWKQMQLRGSTVFARCDDSGKLLLDDGRVEIRYKREAAKSYRAFEGNLEPSPSSNVLPDEHCVLVEKKKPERKRRGSKAHPLKPKKEMKNPPTVPEADEVLVYADGACSGNPGPAGSGVVMIWSDEDGLKRRELSEYLGHGTNNIAELTAILRALASHPNPKRPMQIFTDSSYSIGVLTKGWKPKANKELIAETRKVLLSLPDVDFIYVRGHTGVELNERADELARAAVEARATAGWLDIN